MDRYDLTRFVEAQESCYQTALKELRSGYKLTHWMWFIFPQLRQLGRSTTAKYFGISGIEEATAYLENPVLAQRLREVTTAILGLPTNDPVKVFGNIDSIKLRSSMTLFDAVAPDDLFARVIDKYFAGKKDGGTLEILRNV